MKYILLAILTLGLTACGTNNTITTTHTVYDATGAIAEQTVTVDESDTSDLASYINAGDGNVTSLNGDISKFSIGFGSYGASYFSINGGRQKAPVNAESNSADALEKIANVVKATKTTITATSDGVLMNSDVPASEENSDSSSQEDTSEVANTTDVENATESEAQAEDLTE